LRNTLPLAFVCGDGPAGAETTRLAAALLLVGASFFVADAVQGIAAGALRGLNDTRMPMLYAAVSFWLVGFSSAYALAFPFHLGAIGIWIGFSLGVTTFAALLVCRFHLLTLHNYLPAPPDSDATPV
jgi:multidrug resistance protein, MATE family